MCKLCGCIRDDLLYCINGDIICDDCFDRYKMMIYVQNTDSSTSELCKSTNITEKTCHDEAIAI